MDNSRVSRFIDSLRRDQATRPPAPVPASGRPSVSVPGLPQVRRTADPAELLDPKALSKIGKLDLIAKTVVDGVMSGLHRSTHKGGCSEFSHHRPYSQGDDIRLIDWRIYAKRDRYYVKQYDDETNLHAWMVVDASGSMSFGHSTITKFEYARIACACLSRLLLKQRDSIGLTIGGGNERIVVPPRPQANHFLAVCSALQRTQSSGKTSVADQLVGLKPQLKRRGLVVVFSDCFGDVDGLAKSAEQLRLRGHDVMVFQVLAPEEISFTFRKTAIFQDLEVSGVKLNVNPGTVRRRYLEKFAKHQAELSRALLRIDVDLQTMTTDQDLGDVLVHFLRRRAASRRASAAGASA